MNLGQARAAMSIDVPPDSPARFKDRMRRARSARLLAALAGAQVSVGSELAGQRVTLRMDGTQMTVISHDKAYATRPGIRR